MGERSTKELTKRAVDAAEAGQWLWDGGARGVSGFGLRVAPGGTKSFIYRYVSPERSQRIVTLGRYPSLTVEQGRDLAKAKAYEVAGGGDPREARKALRSAPRVSALAEHYLITHAASAALRASTVRDARDVLRHVLPTLGKLTVAEVKTDDIRQACALVRQAGLDEAAALVRRRRDAVAQRERLEEETRLAVKRAETARRKAGLEHYRLEARQKHTAQARLLADRADMRAASGKAGTHQANRLRAVLGAMFGIAIEKGYRSDNPCLSVKKHREDERWRNLSEAEVGRLLDACDAYEADRDMSKTARSSADAIRLLLFTGARLREVLKAEWSQFDLEVGVWEKPSTHTKTKRQHRLELEGPALELLREMRDRATHHRFLFPATPRRGIPAGQTGDVPFIASAPRADLKGPWKAIVETARLENVRLHDLRRTMASFMLSDGASLATVGKSLGHTQASTTARYAHLAGSVQREALKTSGERMVSLKGQPQRNPNVLPMKQTSRT